jgi:hypothetical protein
LMTDFETSGLRRTLPLACKMTICEPRVIIYTTYTGHSSNASETVTRALLARNENRFQHRQE